MLNLATILATWNESEFASRPMPWLIQIKKKIRKQRTTTSFVTKEPTRITVCSGERWMKRRCMRCWQRDVLQKYLPCGHRVMCGGCNLSSLDRHDGILKCAKCNSDVQRATAEWPIEHNGSCIVM